MNSHKGARRALSVAISVTVLGLAALAAAPFRVVGLPFAGVALLGLGGLLAGVTRWRLEQSDVDDEARAHLALACAELEAGNPTGAGWAASKAVTVAKTSRTRNRALTTLAWAALGQGYTERAKAALDLVAPSHAIDVYCLAAVEAARGRTELAIQALEVARTAGALTRDGAKLLIDCHLRAFGIERAVMVALQIRQALGRDNCERVVSAARLAGAQAAAAMLAGVLRDAANGPPLSGKTSTLGSASAR